jgi:trigger factor
VRKTLKVNITEPKTWQRVLEIEIPAEKVDVQLYSAYQEYQKRAVVPGFRKGKVPISLLKARYAGAVEQSVLQDLIPSVWEEARKANGIDPIAEPVIDEVHFEPGKPLKFKATVEVRPEISLGQYTGLQAIRKEVEVNEDDIENSLRALQERHAVIEPSDEAAGETDIVLVDTWKLDQGGIPIVGQQAKDIPIDLSAPNIFKEYRQALTGAAAGDERRITVTYPSEHPVKELAGQKNSYLIKVKKITRKTLPPLNDEFAKSVSDLATLEELKEGLRKSIQEQEEQKTRREVEEQIIDQIIEKNPFEVPESMVGGYVESLIADLHAGEKQDEDRDQLRQTYRPLAVRAIKRWFILEKVRKMEGIEVDEKELEKKVAAMAKARNIDVQKLSSHLTTSDQMNRLRRSMEEEKTLDLLVSKSTVITSPTSSQ